MYFNSIALPWWDRDTHYYKRTIVAGGGGIVRVPFGMEKDDAIVQIKDGKRLLRQSRFGEIVESNP